MPKPSPRIYWVEMEDGSRRSYDEHRDYLFRVLKLNCWICSRRPSWTQRRRWPTLDHRIPRVLGGLDHESNLALACMECNAKKGRATTLPAANKQ